MVGLEVTFHTLFYKAIFNKNKNKNSEKEEEILRVLSQKPVFKPQIYHH